MPPRNKAMSFELNGCNAQIFAAAVPILSRMPEPVPLMTYWFVAILGTITCFVIGKQKGHGHVENKHFLNEEFSRKLDLWED